MAKRLVKAWGAAGLVISAAACATLGTAPPAPSPAQPRLARSSIPVISADGLEFRDLDRNGTLTPYEDWRLSPAARAADLADRLSLEEKAGLMVVASLANNAPRGEPATGYDEASLNRQLLERHTPYLISRLSTETALLAEANNRVQAVAEQTRWGIPALIMTDPRHGFTELAGASVAGGQFSQWPNGVGIAALNDPAAVERYADMVRGDLRSAGFAMLLGPQIDLASEPRWPRNFDTYGEDAEISASTAAAFVRGLQGGAQGLGPHSVAAVIKHFAGYSASSTGFDAHNYYGRYARLNAAEWEQHIRPFAGALEANPAGVMPSYSIIEELVLDGEPLVQAGAGYNHRLLTGELRNRLGFYGVILSDWAITSDCSERCRDGAPVGEAPSFADVSTAWGVEHLSRPERFALGLRAGLDQFGGVDDPAPLIEAVQLGLVHEDWLEGPVRRLLEQSFALGLFENPFVEPAHAAATIGTPDEIAAGRSAQAQSMVLLEADRALTLAPGTRVALFGVRADTAIAAGLVPVADPADAEIAILRARSPAEMLHPGYVFGAMHQEGSLAFPADHPALAFMTSLPAGLPLMADVQLDRPAILTPFRPRAQVLLASFGASDAALFDVLSGRVIPRGQLPFELPSSMDAVAAQRPGAPADSQAPLYPLGYRLPR